MRLNRFFNITATTLFLITPVVMADNDSVPSSLNQDSVNLTTGEFYHSFISKDIQKRDKYRLYLLGVLDATEGKIWCDYSTVKTVSIRELLYEEMKKLSEEELQERAAHKIKEILSKKLACREP